MAEHLDPVVAYLVTQSWQITLLVVMAGLLSWLLRNRSAHIRYLLWLIVLAKCLVPPVVDVPVAVLPAPEPVAVAISLMPAPEAPAPATAIDERLVATVASGPPVSAPLSTRQGLALLWMAGATIFALVALTKAARTARWLRRQRQRLPDDLKTAIETLLSSLGVKRLPRIWLVEEIGQPFVWGLARGEIYLPTHFTQLEDREHRRDILGHELSHILRFDAAVNTLQIVAQAVFWFHPFVWWANLRIRQEREKCCDEMAIARFGASVKSYSTAIIDTVARAHKSARPVPSLAVGASLKHIEERIRAMLTPGRKFHKHPSLIAVTVTAMVALLVVPTALVLTARVQAETTPETSTEKPSTLLSEAALAGDLDEVNRLIDQGADVNVAQGDKAQTPLHLAASNGHVEVVKTLLARGADVNVVDADGNTALVSAIYSQNGEETVKALIEGGIDVNKGPQDAQPLNFAIWMSSTRMVEALLDAGAKTDVKDSGGWTPLYYAAFFDTRDNEMLELFLGKTKQPDTIYLAAYRGDLEAVKSYVSSGADVNVKDSAGFMPLHWAVLQESPAVAEYLIAHGAEINETVGRFLTPLYCANAMPVIELLVSKGAAINTDNTQDALHKACRIGDIDVATFLISRGADVNAKASAGNTPLTYALQHGHAEVVRLLVANGADTNAKSDSGWAPLRRAIRTGNKSAVELLIANGADTEASPSGLTPLDEAKRRENTEIVNILREHGVKGTLHGAACLGDIDEVRRLLADGADINAKSASGWTPLHWAVYEGHEAVAKLLLARGADINAQFRLGGTPLSFAAIKGQKDMVEFLLAKGADVNTGTPLVGAAANGHTAVVDLLLTRGADVNLKYNGRTALDMAKEKNHTEIVELLRQQGATE